MSRIEQSLTNYFDKNRLVFWYDDKGEMRSEFDGISLPEVTKLEIENNEFALKKQILKDEPEQKFLIYSSTPAPENEENWLLDLNLAGICFSADASSLIL